MSVPILLLIETSTEVCSVALSKGAELMAEIVVNEPKSHARIIGNIINEVLSECSLKITDCDAVVVSEGPGSYTGLRVGVSIAKGLCYGAKKPLIAVSSLKLLARLVLESNVQFSKNAIIVPMIDARRMEVYTCRYDLNGNALSETEALVIDENSFSKELDFGQVIFTGDGARKIENVIKHSNATFCAYDASAKGMIKPALEAFYNGNFVDTAYFEPFYLKDFVPGVSKKGSLLKSLIK